MSSTVTRANWVALYKNLQKEAAKFPQYNYRAFFQRRIRDHFAKNRTVTDPQQQLALYKEGQHNLEVIRRQAIINTLYPHQKTAVEAHAKTMRECRKCKSSEFTNKNLKMLINECGHPLCKNCVDNLFARNAAPCEVCGKMLKKNNFWEQVFDDPLIEKENHIRKRIRKIYNLHESDFSNLREFNDYLERVETIVMNLLYDQDIDETEKQIRSFQDTYSEQIDRNRRRLNPDDVWIQQQIREEAAMKARLSDLKSTDEFKTKQDGHAIKDAKEVIKELRESNVAAGLILDRERKRQIEQDLEEREKQEHRKKVKKERKRWDGLSFAEHRPSGRPYIHKPFMPDINGPPMLSVQEIEANGYLRFVREPSAHRRAGGYTAMLACYHALLEARLDLFAVETKLLAAAKES